MNEWMNEWYVYFALKQEYFYNKEQLVNTIHESINDNLI